MLVPKQKNYLIHQVIKTKNTNICRDNINLILKNVPIAFDSGVLLISYKMRY